MAQAKKAPKPKQALSKVALAKQKLLKNAGNKNLAQQQRDQAALKKAKQEARMEAAYDKEYSKIQTAMAKQ